MIILSIFIQVSALLCISHRSTIGCWLTRRTTITCIQLRSILTNLKLYCSINAQVPSSLGKSASFSELFAPGRLVFPLAIPSITSRVTWPAWDKNTPQFPKFVTTTLLYKVIYSEIRLKSRKQQWNFTLQPISKANWALNPYATTPHTWQQRAQAQQAASC